MKAPDWWRVDPWYWKTRKRLLLLRGYADGDYLAPAGATLRRGTFEDGWPDCEKARFRFREVTQCASAPAALERALELGGFRRPLPATQTPWKVRYWRIVDTLERFRGVDPFVLNMRGTLARNGELSPKLTGILNASIHRLRGPWAPSIDAQNGV